MNKPGITTESGITTGAGLAATAPVAILTRPQGQAQGLLKRLSEAGFETHDWPALTTTTRPAQTLPDPGDFDLVLFVSGNAVRHFQAQRSSLGLGNWPRHIPIATVGPSSAQACVQMWGAGLHIVQPAADAASFDSEALWAELQRGALQLQRVLIVRGGPGAEGEGRNWLASRWRQAGVEVVLHSAYLRGTEPWPLERLQQVRAWQQAGRAITWLWSSREGVEGVLAQWGAAALTRAWQGSRVVVTHERVAEAVRQLAVQGGLTEVKYTSDRPLQHNTLVIQVCLPHETDIVATFVL